MSKKLPSVTGDEAIAAFEKIGYGLDRIRGSHHILKHQHKTKHLSIPVHGTKAVGHGLLRSQIRAAEITVDEFVDLL